jgi:hypothetical protein
LDAMQMNTNNTSKTNIHYQNVLIIVNFLFLLLMLIYRMGPTIADVDIWHEMALARKAIEIGYVPHHDLFSYTKTIYPSVHHEFGAGVIAYFVTLFLGGDGIVIMRYMLVAIVILILLYALKRKRSNPYIVLFILPLPIFFFAYGTSAVRAQMYSFVFTTILLLFFDIDEQGKRWWVFVWLLIFTAWVNIHGGFLVGVGLTMIYGFEQYIRRRPYKHIVGLIAAMAIFIVINPYGIHYYPYLLNAVMMDRPNVSEWNSLLDSGYIVELGLFIVALLLTLYVVIKKNFKNIEGIYILLATALVSVKAIRFLPFFSILWIYMMPKWIEHTPLGVSIINLYKNKAPILFTIFIASAAIFAVKIAQIAPWKLQIPNSSRPEWGKHTIYPVGGVEYLSSHNVRGNILVPFNYGAFVLWKLHPNVKVSLDSRYEVAYPAEVFDDQFKLYMGAENWRELLKKYNPDFILTRTVLPLSKNIHQLRDWSLVYYDANWEIFAKNDIDLPLVVGPKGYYSGTIN